MSRGRKTATSPRRHRAEWFTRLNRFWYQQIDLEPRWLAGRDRPGRRGPRGRRHHRAALREDAAARSDGTGGSVHDSLKSVCVVASPRNVLRPTPSGRSLKIASPLSSRPVVMLYGEPGFRRPLIDAAHPPEMGPPKFQLSR